MSRRKQKEENPTEAPVEKTGPLEFQGYQITPEALLEIEHKLAGRGVYWARQRGRLLEALTHPDGQLLAVRNG